MTFRGDTYSRTLKVNFADKTPYQFTNGDKVKTVFVGTNKTKYLEKEITVESNKYEVQLQWTPEEMKTLPIDYYILEVEITTGEFVKTYQTVITVKEDYIYD